jgi:hypothetical protein
VGRAMILAGVALMLVRKEHALERWRLLRWLIANIRCARPFATRAKDPLVKAFVKVARDAWGTEPRAAPASAAVPSTHIRKRAFLMHQGRVV